MPTWLGLGTAVSFSYLVAAPPEAGWSVEPDDLAGWLRADWPGATTAPPAAERLRVTSLDFWIPLDGRESAGRLAATHRSISLDASLSAFARLAVWVRDRTGGAEGLVAYNPSSGEIVPLTPETTAADIIRGLG